MIMISAIFSEHIDLKKKTTIKKKKRRTQVNNLGYGEPLIGFWPYFLQAQRSEGTTTPPVLLLLLPSWSAADDAGAGMQITLLACPFLHNHTRHRINSLRDMKEYHTLQLSFVIYWLMEHKGLYPTVYALKKNITHLT